MSNADRIMHAAQAIPFTERDRTARIMKIFGKLGKELGYEVNCKKSHYPAAYGHGRVYDMTWWLSVEPYILRRVPMALESEFNASEDDLDDFQKLVQARADVRVWISASSNARRHIDYCKRQIKLFAGSQQGDQYVFAVYDKTAKQPLIEKFIATPRR
jgi:hypothetical protein